MCEHQLVLRPSQPVKQQRSSSGSCYFTRCRHSAARTRREFGLVDVVENFDVIVFAREMEYQVRGLD